MTRYCQVIVSRRPRRERRTHLGERTAAGNGIGPGKQIIRRRLIVDAGPDNAGHVEVLGVADVFHVVKTDAGANDRLLVEGVCRAKPGREVQIFRLAQVVIQPERVGTHDRRDCPAEAQTRVRVGTIVALPRKLRPLGLRLVEAVVDRRDRDREIVPQRVGERRRQLVPQAQQERQLVRGPPVVVDKRVEDVAYELSLGDGQRSGRVERLAEQKLGEGVAAGVVHRVSSEIRLEREDPAGKLVADLVEVLPVVLGAHADGVTSLQPRQLVDELQRAVVDGERAVVGITDVVEPGSVHAQQKIGVFGVGIIVPAESVVAKSQSCDRRNGHQR